MWARLLFVLMICNGCLNPEAPNHPSDHSIVVLEVPPGSTALGLTETLLDQGLIPSKWKWKWYLRQTKTNCLKAGSFEVKPSFSMVQLLDTLCGVPLSDDVIFTVVEGWRIQEIDAALAKQGFIEPGEYAAVAKTKDVTMPFSIPSATLEGYLYPESYRISPTQFSVTSFIEKQLHTFYERFYLPHQDALKTRGLHPIVVMASLLEREEPTLSKRPLVAGILWKRLDHDWNLGVDATSRYTLDTWNDRKAFLKQLRDPNDVYNTRLRPGLPPTAIGNPNLSALKAAISPETSKFWYYLHDKNGTLHPSRSAAEHEQKRQTYNVY